MASEIIKVLLGTIIKVLRGNKGSAKRSAFAFFTLLLNILLINVWSFVPLFLVKSQDSRDCDWK